MPAIQWFIDNGCELTSPSIDMFIGIYYAEASDPCKRCNCKDTCPAWPKVKALKQRTDDV